MLYCLAVSVRRHYPRPVRTHTVAEGLKACLGLTTERRSSATLFFVAMPCKIPLTFKETGPFAGPHRQENKAPWGYLRLEPIVYSGYLFNLPLREQ